MKGIQTHKILLKGTKGIRNTKRELKNHGNARSIRKCSRTLWGTNGYKPKLLVLD
jgi:hypothetical protein